MTDPRFRTAEIVQERRGDPASRRLTFSATSEAPVRMRSWELGEYLEILDHSPGAIRLDRLRSAAPLLKDHDRTAQIGVVESVEIQERRLVVAVRLGSSDVADAEARDIADGIRRNVSVGYIVHKLELVEKRGASGPDVYRATDWEPVEVSTVAIPADVSVGIGRSDASQPIRTRIVREEIRQMPEPTPTPTDFPSADAPALVAATRAERDRAREIFAYGDRFNMPQEARAAVDSGMSVAAFRDQVWARLPEGKPLETPKTYLGMRSGSRMSLSPRESDAYADAFASWIRGSATGRVERSLATEISEQLEKNQTPRGERSLLVPDDFWAPMLSQRDLSVGTPTAGGNLVATDLLASSFVEVLRPRSAVIQMGARTLPGLVGNVDIPRQTGGSAAAFVGEGSNVPENQPTFDRISMVPRTLGVRTDVTRKLMLQSTPAILGVVRNDLANGMATVIDATAINGSGVAPIPRGILNVVGIGSVTWVPTNGLTKLQSVISLMTAVAAANGDSGAEGFITTPEVRAHLMSVYPDPGAGAPVWPLTRSADGRSSLLGFAASVTNNAPKTLAPGTAHPLIFGNWSEIILGLWGTLEIQLDPYTLGDSGGMVMRAFQDLDFGVRHAQSFAATTFVP